MLTLVPFVSRMNDPEQVRKRSKLMLPAPQISDRELEEVSRAVYKRVFVSQRVESRKVDADFRFSGWEVAISSVEVVLRTSAFCFGV